MLPVSLPYCLCLLSVFFWEYTHAHAAPPRKRALLVGIGQYASPEWPPLSASYDIQLVKKALQGQGFEGEHNVRVLQDQQATKQGMLQMFQQFLQESRQGDIVVLHFSVHGQQVLDRNGDEVDGLDEALVPYDAPNQFITKEYQGEKHLLDDEIGNFLLQLRGQIGPSGDILVVMDACHSGTNTRGETTVVHSRGAEFPIAPPGLNQPEEMTGTFGLYQEDVHAEKLAPLVVISGTDAGERNYETMDENGNFVGTLSYAFSKVMQQLYKDMTYQQFFEQIQVAVNAKVKGQHPQLEGQANRVVLGGHLIPYQPSFTADHWNIQKRELHVRAGTLYGFLEGSTVGLYPASVSDIGQQPALCEGVVTTASLLDCTVQLNKEISEEVALSSKIMMHRQYFGAMKIAVKVEVAGTLGQTLRDQLSALAEVMLVGEKEDILIKRDSSPQGSLVILSRQDTLFQTTAENAKPATTLQAITNLVQQVAYVRFFRQLSFTNPDRQVIFSIQPYQVKTLTNNKEEVMRFDIQGPVSLTQYRNSAGEITFRDGDFFTFIITNKGTQPAYYTILDIRPNDELDVLIPYGNYTPQAFLIQPGETLDLYQQYHIIYQFAPPYGQEVFKLIATDTPLDLRPILSMTDPATRAAFSSANPWEMLLDHTAQSEHVSNGSVPAPSAHIYSQVIQVNAPKEDE